MGYYKDREIEEDEQGWRYSDKVICFRCVSDPYLRRMIKSHASKSKCDFCNSSSRKAFNSVPFNELMKVIAEAIFQHYSHAEEAGIAWDSEDQCYVGSTYSTWELVRYETDPSEKEEVLQEIIDSLGDHIWCDRTPYLLSDVERYEYSWDDFCKAVKHEKRYFFNSGDEIDGYSETIPVPQMLDELQSLIDETSLVRTLPATTPFFRVRAHPRAEVCNSWQHLGSPPPEKSVTSRMSPAGISMFYAALDMATAKAEITVSLPPNDVSVLTGAKWVSTRAFKVLDLAALPEPPSFFAGVRFDRERLLFLKTFVDSITQPVAHDGKEHIDYVPTQILTEYFRYRYRSHDQSRLGGIIYPSAQRKHGRSIVIFASHGDLDPNHSASPDGMPPLLALDSLSIKRLRRLRGCERGAVH